MKNSVRSPMVRQALAILAAVLMVAAAKPLDARDRGRAGDTRSSSASSGSPPQATTSSSSRSSGSGAKVTRSNNPSSGGTAHRGSRSSTRSRRHRGSSHYYRGYYGGFWGNWGIGYSPWGYYGHYYPSYPIFPTLYYGPYPGPYGDYRLGAVDLNVRPKKTEVWVDGQLVGMSGKFDGFPGYLWLGRGRHKLVFHNPGYKTEVREIRVLEGAVVRFHLRLEPGESTAPEKLVALRPDRPRRPGAERSGSAVDEDTIARQVEPERSEPGRLRLSIEPGDASVYLDGRFLGTAKELSRLHAGLLVEDGEHILEVVRPGYGSEQIEVIVHPEAETEISIGLEPE